MRAARATFCSTLDQQATRLAALVDGRARETRESIDKRVAAIEERRDARILERTETITARMERIGARATTSEEKAAFEAFKTSVSTALGERDRQVTAALEKFRTDAQALIGGREATVAAARATLKSSLDTALTKARTDCAANVRPDTIRDTFRASVLSAQETFKSAVTEKRDMRAELEALRKTRDASVRAAGETFKASFDTALKTLRATVSR